MARVSPHTDPLVEICCRREKEKMQQWADEMRQHYEEQKLRMKEEFNESLNDLRTRLTSQQNIADVSERFLRASSSNGRARA